MSKRLDGDCWDSQRWKDQFVFAQAVLEAPSVTLDGTRYWSDRFYLNQVDGEKLQEVHCVCGAQEAPPVLSRERLVESLDLQAVVLGTFSADVVWLKEAFPRLVGPNATVPTLILHGDRKLDKQANGTACDDEDDGDDVDCNYDVDGVVSSPDHPSSRDVDFQSNLSNGRSESAMNRSYRASSTPTNHDSKKQPSKDIRVSCISLLGPSCFLSFVPTTWINPHDASVRVSSESSAMDDFPSLHSKRGVHHPKFMILLEKNGDLVVVVSTANLTRAQTTDGTWLQRFRCNRRHLRTQQAHADRKRIPRVHGNDFGTALQDFLEKLDEASQGVSIAEFFSQYMHFSLTELAPSFHFETAQVHLVPVVPGNWKPSCHKYGRQRVRHILQKETLVVSSHDRLLVQPTSLGGNWTRGEMVHVIRSYLHDVESEDDETLFRQMDIIWPSRSFIRNATNAHDKILTVTDTVKDSFNKNKEQSSFVFMSSRTFNSCDRSCISRMVRFENSHPPQRSSSSVPHFKSIGRLINDTSVVRKHGFHALAQEHLSWFLLTSACLSHGAQGKRTIDPDPFAVTKETIQYANFELGVLFTSRIRSRDKRLYCFNPQVCCCNSLGDPQQRLIHLPIPYSLRSKPYLLKDDDDEDESIMEETPYFHEIEEGTQCVGNMLLTPYGIRAAKKQRRCTTQNIATN